MKNVRISWCFLTNGPFLLVKEKARSDDDGYAYSVRISFVISVWAP